MSLPLVAITWPVARQATDQDFYPCSILLLLGITHSRSQACDDGNGSLDILTGSSGSTPSTLDLTTPTQETRFTDEAYRNSHLNSGPLNISKAI
jgi:hypothetical protein